MGKSALYALFTKYRFHSLIFSPFQHFTHSSCMDKLLSGITKFSSIPTILPNPSHLGHAPAGLLKLNIISVGSSKMIPSASNLFENTNDSIPFSPQKRIKHSPFPSRKAVSTESDKRFTVALSDEHESRSITRRTSSNGGRFFCSSNSSIR